MKALVVSLLFSGRWWVLLMFAANLIPFRCLILSCCTFVNMISELTKEI